MKTKKILITLIATFVVVALVFQSCKKEEEEENNKLPTCKITAPVNNQEIIKGETILVSVEAKDSDGSITKVRFFLDGVEESSTNSSPYNFTWNTNNQSIGNHTLKATSTDNSGGNTSDEIIIAIVAGGGGNTPPTAEFTVSPANGTTNTIFAFDASGCTDNEDATSSLQIRWDFNGDGNWDTDWNYNKTENHQFDNEATYTTKLEVKDPEGLIGQYEKDIAVTIGSSTGTFTDPRDGQVYTTVVIGSQTWFAENLNYETTDSWWYENSSANGDIYGRLYTWEAALTACPPGWHLPSNDEWNVIANFLGGGTIAGSQMKESGTAHWVAPNADATNSSGFTALPAGYYYNGIFNHLGTITFIWSSTEHSDSEAIDRFLTSGNPQLHYSDDTKTKGFSIRCIKD